MRIQVSVLVAAALSFATSAHGRFSQFVRIYPEAEQHERSAIAPHAQRLIPSISFASDSRNHLDIEVSIISGGRRYWLVTGREKVSPENQNFRRDVQLLSHDSPRLRIAISPARDDLELIVPITACCERHEPKTDGKDSRFIFRLSRSLAERSYIYIDYPQWGVVDGGFYFTIDLPAYLKAFDESQALTEQSAVGVGVPAPQR